MSLALALHLLAAVVWVGGMFFAHLCLRPSALAALEPPQRLTLWNQVFRRFFLWVWIAILTLPVTGYWMVFAGFGGMEHVHWPIHLMQSTALIMIGIYLWIYFGPYQELRRAVGDQRWPDGGTALNRIRPLVLTNLTLGLITVAVAGVGRWLQ